MWSGIWLWFLSSFSSWLVMFSIFHVLSGHLHIFLGKCLQFAFLKLDLLLLLTCWYSLYVQGINLLSALLYANFFYHSVDYFLTLLLIPFIHKSFKSLLLLTYVFIKSNFLPFLLLPVLLVSHPRHEFNKLLPNAMASPNVFSWEFCNFSTYSFRPLMHFDLIFIYGVREGSNFTLLHVDIELSQYHLVRTFSFAPLNDVSILVKIHLTVYAKTFPWLSILFHWFLCLSLCHYHSILITLVLHPLYPFSLPPTPISGKPSI